MTPASPRARRQREAKSVPREDEEQAALAVWLGGRGLLWTHCPNGGMRAWHTARRMKQMGVSSGVPDVLIFTPPPWPEDGVPWVGTALELKRRVGGRTSPEQKAWLAALAKVGWKTLLCSGAEQAIVALRALGY